MGLDLDQFQQAVEAFTDNLLAGYSDRLEANLARLKLLNESKEVNDPIWHTITLHPFEVAVIDSPIFQRLRRLRQLGVVHWVFPAAHHTRFEHTIGTVQQIQELVTSVNTHQRSGRTPIPLTWCNLLRLAALCHDLGHGLMSHVSENALQGLSTINDLRIEFTKRNRTRFALGKNPKLAEIITIYMVGSNEFSRLLTLAKSLSDDHPLPPIEEVPLLIQKAVLGTKLHDDYPILHEFLSGPFDADKLDYMSRDSGHAGVPRVTDVPRLIEKTRMVWVPRAKLPNRIAAVTPNTCEGCWIQAISLSAAKTLDELLIGRTLLYDKVYRHQKVRQLESYVQSFLFALAAAVPMHEVPLLGLYLADDEFTAGVLGGLPVDPESESVIVAVNLAKRINERRLPVRAYAFPPHADLPEEDHEITAVAKRLIEELRKQGSARRFQQEVVSRTREIVEVLRVAGRTYPAHVIDSELDMLDHTVSLSISDIHGEPTKIGNAYLLLPEGDLSEFQTESEHSKPWSNSYVATRDFTYLFAPAELAAEVNLAVEVVQMGRHGVILPGSLQATKIPRGLVDDLRRDLTSAGFYTGKLWPLRSVPAELQTEGMARRISKVASHLASFEGVGFTNAQQNSSVITERQVFEWLRQFDEAPHLIDDAMELLEGLRILGRADVVDALEQRLKLGKTLVCRLGGPGDSSAILNYYVKDLAARYEVEPVELGQALEREGRILFLDDFVGSGGQSITILKQLLGDESEGGLDEDHVAPLNDEQKRHLLEREVEFLFVGGQSDGLEELKQFIGGHGMNATASVHIQEHALPTAFADFESDIAVFCRAVGKEVLPTSSHSAGKERSPEWLNERTLGYGNQAFLVAFPYNIPTQSLTLLWCDGSYRGNPWKPLLPRRKKL